MKHRMTTDALLDLLFPRLCVVCGRRLQSDEPHLCLHCLQHLPRTKFHEETEHAMEQLFRGKADIDAAFALFYSTPHSDYRNLLHHIKYHNGKECARYLGQLYARELRASGQLDSIDKSVIFRTLVLFHEHHLIHSVDDGSGSHKYCICHNHGHCHEEEAHCHFYCEICQNTYCLNEDLIPHIELPEGFTARKVNYIVKGICAKCAAKHSV